MRQWSNILLLKATLIPVMVLWSSLLQASHPPYQLPDIKSCSDFQQVVYIDPSGEGGDGSRHSPLNSLQGLEPQPGTAYLIRRGTVLNEHVSNRWNNNLLGAYGHGARPVIGRGVRIRTGTRDFTLRDLVILKPGTGSNDVILAFDQRPAPRDVTIAFCSILGIDEGRGYPFYALEHGADNLVFFNNEVAFSRNNGWWLNANQVKIIRNWFHNINKDGEHSPHSSGDIIQSIYFLPQAYIAGNIFDKSNSMWKYTLMLNLQGSNEGIVVEYNTFYAPREGAGGAAIRWTPGSNAIFRRNLIRSIDPGNQRLVVPFETWQPIADQPFPYGIRDNHIIADTGSESVVAYDRARLDSSNRLFRSNQAYELFLRENPGIGLYGSDIDTSTFNFHFQP